MSIVLFVGDITSEVLDAAIKYDDNAQLLIEKNLNNLLPGTYYTSLADCGSLENLSKVCSQSAEIYYIQPIRWSDTDKNNVSEQKKWTELILYYFCQTKTVHNMTEPTINNWICDYRQHEKQFWVAGCSVTEGAGVKKEQAWPELISKELMLPYSNLSRDGSSIIWQSDQICRADIRADEIVFWGVTSNQRMPILRPDGSLLHLTATNFSNDPYIVNKLTPEILDNNTLYYQNILAVRRAYNYCQKIGAYLVPLGLLNDFENIYTQYNVPAFYQLIQWGINSYIDLGDDNLHPGPEQHKIFAKEFLSHYRKIYLQ